MPLAAGRLPATFKEKTIAGDNSYKPGEIVKVSGIYSVVHDDGKNTFEVTCVDGEHFPPTRSGKGAHFELKYAATHSSYRDGRLARGCGLVTVRQRPGTAKGVLFVTRGRRDR
jgi:hypothetical protein